MVAQTMSNTPSTVGGQAVIEGVMMRSPNHLTVAVRRKNNEIVVREEAWRSTFPGWVRKVPFLRGALTLIESMQNGNRALRFSAEQYEADLAEDDAPTGSAPGEAPASDSGVANRLGVVLSIGLMVALPKILAWGLGRVAVGGLTMGDPRFHMLAGFFKLCIIIGMMLLMRRNQEMFRVFQYHGAEHKAIAVHEAGLPLTVDSARQFTTRHARCGTTFLMVVVVVGVAIFSIVLPMFLPNDSSPLTMLKSIFISIPLMFPIAGVAYELQRLGARYVDHPLAKLFLAPGYLVQRITTAEPTDDQVEIAFVALKRALAREAESAARAEPVVRTFPSFAAFAGQG